MITEKIETTDGYFDKLIELLDERLSELLMRVVEAKLDRYFKRPAKRKYQFLRTETKLIEINFRVALPLGINNT